VDRSGCRLGIRMVAWNRVGGVEVEGFGSGYAPTSRSNLICAYSSFFWL